MKRINCRLLLTLIVGLFLMPARVQGQAETISPTLENSLQKIRLQGEIIDVYITAEDLDKVIESLRELMQLNIPARDRNSEYYEMETRNILINSIGFLVNRALSHEHSDEEKSRAAAEAHKIIRQYLETYKDNNAISSELNHMLGQLLREEGKFVEAVQAFRRAQSLLD